MDWTKAKNILIIALLITDLVLIGSILIGISGDKARNDQYLQDSLALLSERQIFVDAKIPNDQIRMPVLSVEYDNIDKMLLEQTLNRQIALPKDQWTEEKIREVTDDFLRNCEIMTENVAFESINESAGTYTIKYNNQIKGIALEDSYIICTFSGGKVQTLQRLWLQPMGLGKNKKQVIPIAEALIQFMSDKQEFDEIHITNLELVYWLDTSSLDLESPISDTAFPAWKITYNSGKIKHVSAFRQ
jgi:regulatory protein YycI of two-component signal transduction system YycFG